MLITIIGGAASGKSAMAEDIALKLGGKLAYVATMQSVGAEEVIARHIKLRSGKGFQTIECSKNLHELDVSNYDTILIECMSNLLANEMFSNGDIDNIYKGINTLTCKNVIIVTNDIFADIFNYSNETLLYINKLGEINAYLAKRSDIVIESVVGIAFYIKGAL